MTAFVSFFLGTGLAGSRQFPVTCAHQQRFRASTRAMTDWDLGFCGMFHNEGSTWSGQGDMWVTFSAESSSVMNEGGDDDDTVQYGENTVFASDLCDISGEGCGPDGVPPPDAMKPIGKEDRSARVSEAAEVVDRGVVEYSTTSSVFVDDDTIAK